VWRYMGPFKRWVPFYSLLLTGPCGGLSKNISCAFLAIRANAVTDCTADQRAASNSYRKAKVIPPAPSELVSLAVSSMFVQPVGGFRKT